MLFFGILRDLLIINHQVEHFDWTFPGFLMVISIDTAMYKKKTYPEK